MKALFISIFSIIFLSNSEYVLGQNLFEHYSSKEALESDVKKIIIDFDLFIRDIGFNPPYIPTVIIQTGPFLIKWDETNKAVILPYWNDLSNEQIEIFKSWRGENDEEFFVSMFNWFFIPHELGHFINPMNHDLKPYKRERAANEFAIAFLISNKENLERINFIKKSLQEVLEILPKIDFNNMSEEEYFNTYYSKIGNYPNTYGYFQFKIILDILNNQENINILHYLDQEIK